MGVCLMNELLSRGDAYAQIVCEAETCALYSSCPETNQHNIDRDIRPLAKVSNSSVRRSCSNREIVFGIKPDIGREFTREIRTSHWQRW